MSSIVNKIKEVIHSDNKAHHSQPEGTSGPHNSRVANAADPRVDSDRDGSHRTAGHGEFGSTNNNTFGTTGHNTLGGSNTHTGTHTGAHNTFGSSGTSEGATGPHNSRVANALDPRVDSDRDGSNTMGNNRHTGAGIGGTHSNQHSGLPGSGATGMSGTHGAPTGTYGTHNSRIANAADPRIDSDRDGRAGFHGSGPGPAPHTAGPHSNDMMNKVDPRVDSDLDGSKTLGGNKTYQ